MFYFKEQILEPENIVIVPEDSKGGYAVEIDTNDFKRISGTYMHGELQGMFSYDLFLILTKTMPTHTGIFPVTVLGKEDVPSTFFLWNDKGNSGRVHGLVVANNDKSSLEYALNQYLNKAISI